MPEKQGAGIGRALVEAVIQRAVESGVAHLLLYTEPEMRAAHHLYEEAGFTRLTERDWSPELGTTLLAYELRLSRAAPAG